MSYKNIQEEDRHFVLWGSKGGFVICAGIYLIIYIIYLFYYTNVYTLKWLIGYALMWSM